MQMAQPPQTRTAGKKERAPLRMQCMSGPDSRNGFL